MMIDLVLDVLTLVLGVVMSLGVVVLAVTRQFEAPHLFALVVGLWMIYAALSHWIGACAMADVAEFAAGLALVGWSVAAPGRGRMRKIPAFAIGLWLALRPLSGWILGGN